MGWVMTFSAGAPDWASRPLGRPHSGTLAGRPAQLLPPTGTVKYRGLRLVAFTISTCGIGSSCYETGVKNGTWLMPDGTIIFVVRGMSLKSEFRVGIASVRWHLGRTARRSLPKGLTRLSWRICCVRGQLRYSNWLTKLVMVQAPSTEPTKSRGPTAVSPRTARHRPHPRHTGRQN